MLFTKSTNLNFLTFATFNTRINSYCKCNFPSPARSSQCVWLKTPSKMLWTSSCLTQYSKITVNLIHFQIMYSSSLVYIITKIHCIWFLHLMLTLRDIRTTVGPSFNSQLQVMSIHVYNSCWLRLHVCEYIVMVLNQWSPKSLWHW